MSPRGLGPCSACHVCKGTDHFARTCPQLHENQQQRPINSHLTDNNNASPLLNDEGAMDLDLPPPVSAPSGAIDDPTDAEFIPSIKSIDAVS